MSIWEHFFEATFGVEVVAAASLLVGADGKRLESFAFKGLADGVDEPSSDPLPLIGGGDVHVHMTRVFSDEEKSE